MKPILITLLGILASLPVIAGKPNFIIIFTDDQGYNDLGCFGSEKIKTPNIDRLATEGRKFTSFMVPSSVCSPSRAALLTGCYPKRVGLHKHVIFPANDYGLNPKEFTIPRLFKSLGYVTACIGKWHLGHRPAVLPTAHGFDSYFGIPYSNNMNHPDHSFSDNPFADKIWTDPAKWTKKFNVPLMEGTEIIELPVDQRTITSRYTDRAISFITENKDKPFFLYLAHTMPHVPLFVPDEARNPDVKNAYTCVIEHLDTEIGRMMKTVRELGLADDTFVIVTSDNGPAPNSRNFGGSAFPLRGAKASPFEGGQRVPCIIWAPGRIPAGTETGELVSSMDLLPSVAAILGTELPADRIIDGIDLSSTITGTPKKGRTEFIYYSAHGVLQGFRQGDWKLLTKGVRGVKETSLFNLANDVEEMKNLASKEPEKVNQLNARMRELDTEITTNARPVWQEK
ncbi:sulfatase family protein [Haloferula sp.]|uniref:sulfatase family protein n=1 Tax=Haloferula sp. TaxID=2497595 RepID=UPI003C74831C